MSSSSFKMSGRNPTPPRYSEENILVTFPGEHTLLISFNRPKTLNAITSSFADDVKRVMAWFDGEPSLWVVIFTGSGRSFCAGMDLISWKEDQESGKDLNYEGMDTPSQLDGVAGISRRRSSKPMIAAVTGYAMGGGLEIVLNCDLVIASEDAKFGYPEVTRGVIVASGGLQRLVRVAGHQLASELLLTGRSISATEARDRFRFINEVVPKHQALPTALKWARTIVAASPDAVQSNKQGIVASLLYGNIDEAVHAHVTSTETKRVFTGENVLEGLRSFSEKRKPKWANPKL